MRIINLSILSTILTIAAACSHTPPPETYPVGTNPADEINKLSADLDQAKANQVEVMAPKSYEEARKSLTKAQDELKSQDDAKDILEDVGQGRAWLKNAQTVAKTSNDAMSEVFAARALAVKEGADKDDDIGVKFRKNDKQLKDVTEEIEKGDLKDAEKNRLKLQTAYLDRELEAIRRNNLAPVQAKINDAVRSGAKKDAPRTLAIAEKSYKDAEAYIIANRHDTAQIKVLSDKAMADANHVKEITGMAHTDEKTSAEEAALALESQQKAVEAKQAELAQTQSALDQQKAAASTAQGELASKEAIDQKYAQARAMFAPNEAEVYRQGNDLVIRLRKLEFATAKADLKGSDFPILSKVQQVIAEFPKSQVTVEGHTDSKGGKALNEKVSQARADSVKSYFESNSGQTSGASFSAVGYGYQKPLASNKTEAGRAQNRRVDIVIHPENM